MSKLSVIPVLVAVLLAGCASEQGGDVYSRDQVQQVQHYKVGTVESLHKVRIQGTQSQIGTTAGAIAGSIAGGGIDQGRAGQVGSVVGAVVGGIAGAATEEAYTRQDGIEYAIRLEDGSHISVVQAASNDIDIRAGDKVRVIENDGVARVVPF